MAMSLPERLHTPRLILRAPRPSDAIPVFASYAQDPEVVRYLVWEPHQCLAETQDFLAYCIEAWKSGRSRPYILALSDNEDVPIGMLEARIATDAIDIGYVLQRSYWGAGLMSEALAAVSTAALAVPGCVRVQATCDLENYASARTLEKCGFIRENLLERHAVLPNLGPAPRSALLYVRGP